MTTRLSPGVDEFAPHWSSILKDGTLSVTFEIETTLTDVPDMPLIDLLRAALLAQRWGRTVPVRMVVNGIEHRGDYPVNVTVETVIAQAVKETLNVGRPPQDWELRDRDGHRIDNALTLEAALSNFPNHDPLWLSLRAGWGS
jgi:hypothetical protein